MSEANKRDGKDCGANHCSVAIYLVGCWVDTGPRANDCYFEVGYVTTDLTLANEMAREFTDAVIMTAKDGSSFIDWEQRNVAFTSL